MLKVGKGDSIFGTSRLKPQTTQHQNLQQLQEWYKNHRGQRGTRILHRRQSCTGGNSSSLPCASCHPCQPTRLHMGNKHEIPALYGLYLGPVRRPLSADSEFFDAGNTARALLCKISVFALISGGDCDSMDFEDHQQQHYECMFRDCPATFSSLARVSLDWLLCGWRGVPLFRVRVDVLYLLCVHTYFEYRR